MFSALAFALVSHFGIVVRTVGYNVKEVLNLFNVSAAATFTIFPPFERKLRSYLAFLTSSQGTLGDGLDPHAATLGKAEVPNGTIE